MPIDPARDYEIFHAATEDEKYPDKFPLQMAMLIAQHSASIPDQHSITYTPKSKWDEKVFGVPIRKGEEGVHALMCMGMGGKKRKRSFADTPSSPASSTCSTVVGGMSCVQETVPRWVMDSFMNAVHRVSSGGEMFSATNFRQEPSNHDERGVPELVKVKEYEGTSFAVRRSPCIVSAAMDGLVSIHKGNKSYMWVAKKHRKGGDKLVYMKCWDPDCQTRIKNARDKPEGKMFDCYGWALLSRENMRGVMDGGH